MTDHLFALKSIKENQANQVKKNENDEDIRLAPKKTQEA
jgi:hypothetical protein